MSGTLYCAYPILPFELVACTFFSDNLPRNSCNLVRLENPVQNLPVLLPLDFLDCGFLLALPTLGLSFTLASSWIYHNKTRHNKYEDKYVEISNRPWRTIRKKTRAYLTKRNWVITSEEKRPSMKTLSLSPNLEFIYTTFFSFFFCFVLFI